MISSGWLRKPTASWRRRSFYRGARCASPNRAAVTDPAIARMKINKQAKRDARQLFTSCKVNGLLDEGRVRQAVSAVIAQKPRSYVAILSHFQRLVKLDLDRRKARVESAAAVSDALKASVTANLTRRYGAGLNISFGVNPELIGGARVKVGSDVFDGSVKARLSALEEGF